MRSSNGTSYQLSGPAYAPTLVLIHGLGLDLRLWDALLPRLPTRTLRLDLPAGAGLEGRRVDVECVAEHADMLTDRRPANSSRQNVRAK